jgi:hypothetical protein
MGFFQDLLERSVVLFGTEDSLPAGAAIEHMVHDAAAHGWR